MQHFPNFLKTEHSRLEKIPTDTDRRPKWKSEDKNSRNKKEATT
jgi:hypothetical protein